MSLLDEIAFGFQTINITLSEQVLGKCMELCTTYKMDAEDLVDQWLAYTASNLNGAPPSLDNLDKMERKELQKQAKKAGVNKIPQLECSKITSVNHGTPTRYNVEKESTKQTLALEQMAKPSSQEISQSSNREILSQQFNERTDSRSVQAEFGTCSLNGFKERSSTMPVVKMQNEGLAASQYMYEKLLLKRGSINAVTRWIAGDIVNYHKLELTEKRMKDYIGEMTICGRVYYENSAKSKVRSLLIEGVLEWYNGFTTELNVNYINKLALFNGKIVVVKGYNMKDFFVAREIYSGAPLLLPEQPVQIQETLQIVVAAGPFTFANNLLYEPLEDLLKYVVEFKPNLLLLLGPFIEATHNILETVNESYDLFFESIVEGIMEKLKGSGVKVIIVPSHKDVHNHVIFPSPSFKTRKNYENLICAPNPCILDIDGLVIGASSMDILSHISKAEMFRDYHQKGTSDKVSHLVSHLFDQRSFYPLHPPDPDVRVDYQLLEKYGMLENSPHLMFLVSDFDHFAKKIQDCVVINPERLVRRHSAGTFARVEIRAGTGAWRKFHFFDLKKDVDEGKIAELFKESRVTVTSSGNNHIVLGDSNGQIHLLSRAWHVRVFRAYEMTVDLAHQLRNSPLLVTVGQDEPGINPLIKVWDTSRFDKNGTPYCCRISRAIPGNRPVHASSLCVHDGLQLMAVGFMDGSLVLYRGDITRDRSSKQKLLRDASSIVTGLAFKTTSTNIFLFLATDSSVIVYNITHKDKEVKFQLDNIGCAKKCSVLAESMVESHFMVGRNDAIYCYTADGRGPCYAVDGEKVMLEWFRSYLVIISKTTRPNLAPMTNENQSSIIQGDLITVLDIHNKFIVFSATVPSIKAILNEWGAFYILDNENRLYHLDEKDLQSKLSLLFKKNLYDVAIRIAKSQQYDSDGLVSIFRQYGDHLCEKGDYVGAIEQYIKTIGKLEPSYVIRKFLDSQHIEKLTMYLEALHKQGHATEDHTTLLLNCYTKLNNTVGQSDSLKEFILMKEGDLNYDVDIAIKVCRQGSPAEALMLAKKHAKHDWYIKLQIEDHQRYVEVLDYISNLSFDNAEFYMKKYGNILIQNAPYESTQFLKRLCTNYKSNNSLDNSLIGSFDISQKSDPEDYIHLFLNNSERLVEFLEYLIGEGCILSTPVYNTLLEHYLHVWGNLENVAEKNKYSQKTLKLLQNPDIKYDKSQALVVCHMHSFSEGILYLYEEQKLYQQILKHHIFKNDANSILACCRRFGHQEPTLWVQALWSCVRDTKNPSIDLLNEILTVIAKERLLSPQLVIDALGSGNAEITLGHIRSYLTNELQQEQKKSKEISELTQNYRKDTEKLKEQLETLKSGSIVIQGSRCAACHHPLELPTIHFLCQHSYHQHCFQSFCEEENECPACQPENKNLLELLKAREYNKDLHETFHSQLEKAHDGFSVAAEYFGRGVFNKYKVIRDDGVEKSLVIPEKMEKKPVITEPEVRNYGLGAEARLRQSERQAGQVIIPTPEGRMRLQEHRYSSSLEANISNFVPKSYEPRKKDYSSEIPGTNPFENDYDESKNPFADDDFDENNPFRDDCDKNSNPFYK
ncbi:vacuolar protein sorting-associated protein 11 -like, partial [Asbolus verrucosus]